MVLYSYIVKRDFGFAPNPFPPYCTLATCKPGIRKSASVNDWILGIGSAAKGSVMRNRLIYAMQVQEKLLFDQYWNDLRFSYKKPVMNGSKRQKYGDNIYHTDDKTKVFIQENSHHSLVDGTVNKYNYDRDLSGKYVLISQNYWYFGKDAIQIPQQYFEFIKKGVGYKIIKDKHLISQVICWLDSLTEKGYISEPYKFAGAFERYDGKS